MENEDYKNLIEFLGNKFDGIDKQFDDIKNNFATKDELKAQAEDYLHQNKIIAENLEHRMDVLAEGFRMNGEQNERDKAEILGAIAKLERDNLHIHAELYDLNNRVKTLEKGR